MIHNSLQAFFNYYSFSPRTPHIPDLIAGLTADMEAGLMKQPPFQSSQDMIPTWMTEPQNPITNKHVIVIDAGGTNFRSCLVSFDTNGHPSITQVERRPMPASDREYSRAEFFNTIASYLDHLKDCAEEIGFCFSYAVEIMNDGDGRVIQFSKEIKAPEVVGTYIGKELLAALHARGWTRVTRVRLVNDTTAVLCAGAADKTSSTKQHAYIGFILGTGVNTAYVEPAPIKKITSTVSAIHKPQIVVCESGKSNKIPRSQFDEIVAAATDIPSAYRLEKMCSGAYLGQLLTTIFHEAAAFGLFSPALTQHFLAQTENIHPSDMSAFLQHPAQGGSGKLHEILAQAKGSSDDYHITHSICTAVVERTARIAAAVIGAAMVKSDPRPDTPITVMCEGTTLLKTPELFAQVKKHIQAIAQTTGTTQVALKTLDNAVIIGTAIAACTDT